MACMCGDPYCPSCGTAQGTWFCPVCGKTEDERCDHLVYLNVFALDGRPLESVPCVDETVDVYEAKCELLAQHGVVNIYVQADPLDEIGEVKS